MNINELIVWLIVTYFLYWILCAIFGKKLNILYVIIIFAMGVILLTVFKQNIIKQVPGRNYPAADSIEAK